MCGRNPPILEHIVVAWGRGENGKTQVGIRAFALMPTLKIIPLPDREGARG